MKNETLFRAIGDVGEDLIARANEPAQKKQPVVWLRWAAMAACCALVVGIAALMLPMHNKSYAPAMDQVVSETALAAPEAEEAKVEVAADKPMAPAPEEGPEPRTEMSQSTTEAPAETADLPMDEPAEAEELPAVEPEEPAPGAGFFDGLSDFAVTFEGRRYDLSDESVTGEHGALLGTVEDSPAPELVGAEVYAYADADSAQTILVADPNREGSFILYEAAE